MTLTAFAKMSIQLQSNLKDLFPQHSPLTE